MIAVWLARFGRCRSMQLCATLVTPSSNHLIETLWVSKDVFLTLENGVNQSMHLPCSAQKPSGSLTDRLYISSYLAALPQARFAHAAGTSYALSDMRPLPSNSSRGVPPSRKKLRRHYALTREKATSRSM